MNFAMTFYPAICRPCGGGTGLHAAGRKYIERILVEQEHAKAGGERGVEGGQFMPSTGTGHAPATKSAGDATAIEPSDLPTADAPGPAVDPGLTNDELDDFRELYPDAPLSEIPLSGSLRAKKGAAQVAVEISFKGFWAVSLALKVVSSDLRRAQGSRRSYGYEKAV